MPLKCTRDVITETTNRRFTTCNGAQTHFDLCAVNHVRLAITFEDCMLVIAGLFVLFPILKIMVL